MSPDLRLSRHMAVGRLVVLADVLWGRQGTASDVELRGMNVVMRSRESQKSSGHIADGALTAHSASPRKARFPTERRCCLSGPASTAAFCCLPRRVVTWGACRVPQGSPLLGAIELDDQLQTRAIRLKIGTSSMVTSTMTASAVRSAFENMRVRKKYLRFPLIAFVFSAMASPPPVAISLWGFDAQALSPTTSERNTARELAKQRSLLSEALTKPSSKKPGAQQHQHGAKWAGNRQRADQRDSDLQCDSDSDAAEEDYARQEEELRSPGSFATSKPIRISWCAPGVR